MNFNNISELSLFGVVKRGVPNEECIAIEVKAQVDVGQFGIMVGVSTAPGFAIPIKDNLFWFGEGLVQPGEWIFVYTCGGTSQRTQSPDGRTLYIVHWDRGSTMFSNNQLVPILFRIDAANVGKTPTDLPQVARIK